MTKYLLEWIPLSDGRSGRLVQKKSGKLRLLAQEESAPLRSWTIMKTKDWVDVNFDTDIKLLTLGQLAVNSKKGNVIVIQNATFASKFILQVGDILGERFLKIKCFQKFWQMLKVRVEKGDLVKSVEGILC